MPLDPIQPLDYAPRESPPARSWLNRVATILCLVCVLMLGIGIAIEATTRILLFENYISTLTVYGLIFAFVASLPKLSRRAR